MTNFIHSCPACGVKNDLQEDFNLFNEEWINSYLHQVFYGQVNKNHLSVQLYSATAKKLTEGIFEGYKLSLDNVIYGGADHIMLYALKRNTYIFSGAKTYQQTRQLQNLISEKGKIKPFNEFKKEAKEVFTKYNEEYLQAEYQNTIACGRMSRQWMEIDMDKDVLKLLQYQTVGDSRVRPTHASLDNITRPVDDKLWDTCYPPNGWRCRCTVIQLEDGDITDMRGFKIPEDVPDAFRFNCGKQKIAFSPKHPYFTHVPNEDLEYAKKNFNLPLPRENEHGP